MRGRERIRSGLAFRLAQRLGRDTVTVGGYWGRFRGHADDNAMLRHYGRHGTWSAGTVAPLVQAARALVAGGEPAPLLVDVGAAIGLVSIGVLRQAPGSALAIESHPETFKYLQHNVAKNRMADRITPLKLAAGAPLADGRSVHMERTPGNGGDSWVVEETGDGSGTPLVRLDALTARYTDRPLLLKVDVQGYEPEVIAGGMETLRRSRLAVLEFWPYGLLRSGHDPAAFADSLLAGARRVALMEDEHRIQQLVWGDAEEARVALTELIADGRPERQLEVLIEGWE